MKKIFFFIVLAQLANAQKMPATTIHDLNRIIEIHEKPSNEKLASLQAEFPIYKMNGNYVLSLFGKKTASFNVEELKGQSIVVGAQIHDIVTLKVPLHALLFIQNYHGLSYLEIPSKVKSNLDKAVKDIRADSVQRGINLPSPYTGKDVYIGITDWGFDYTHPNFYDTNLVQTRIVAAWDQYKQLGNQPVGFSYGVEYDTPQELVTAQSDTANIYGYGYHGSHVAGICAGSGAGTVYRGIAFDANYLFATFLIDAASVIDAYEWMYQRALAAGKRLVINQSWGLHHMGNLDGTSILSQAIDAYSQLGVVFVSSAGNNGGVNFHLSKTFNNDELKSKVDFYDYAANPNMWGQSLTLWGEPSKQFQVSIQVLNSSNALLAETPFYSTQTTTSYIDSSLVTAVNDTIWFNVSCEAANPLNNRPHVRFRVKNTNTALKVIMRVQAVDGTVHCWNVTELTTDVGNWGMPFSSNGAGTVSGNANFGISEPACTNSTIAVAAYAAQYSVGQGTVGGGIANFSSYGPTLDGRVKPDISAPGINIGSSFSSFTDESFSAVASVDFNGRTYPFAKISGTSMSGPMVTGVVAMLLEANPSLTAAEVKDFIKNAARTDNFTGVIPDTGSVRWGFGKINAYRTVLNALGLSSLTSKSNIELEIYPNPVEDFLHIETRASDNDSVQLFSMDGKMYGARIQDQKINVSNLQTGCYILVISNKGAIHHFKFVKK